MKVLKNLGKKLRHSWLNIFSGNYYSDIYECPIWNFHKVMSTGEYKYLRKRGINSPYLGKKSWGKLFNQYIGEFGLPESYKRYLDEMKKACNLYNEAHNKGKIWQDVKAKIKQNEAEKIFDVVGEKLEVTAARLSKAAGFQIDVKKTSVIQFYSYIEMSKNG